MQSKKPLIVCVDDEQGILNVLNMQLKRKFKNRFAYEFAESGEEAIDIIDELVEEGYVLLMTIVDQIMPGMQGDELLVTLHQKYPRAVKILLTGQGGLESTINLINNANLYRYMTKPWEPQDLFLTIERGIGEYYLQEALLTERNLLTQKITEQTEHLKLANMQLAREIRFKDELLSGVNHELRTPLSAVLGSLEALQEGVYGKISQEQDLFIQGAKQSGNFVLSILNDFLNLSKIEAGKLSLQLETIAVDDICQQSLGCVKNLAKNKEIEISFYNKEGVKTVSADRLRLQQILVNLLSNAIKYTPKKGKVTLGIKEDKEHHSLRFLVSDTGIGISQKDIELLFQPFVRIDNELTRSHEGTGLGLSLVCSLTKMHGGGITVESEEGKGSTFTVSLPWRQDISKESEVLDRFPTIAIPQIKKALIVDSFLPSIRRLEEYIRELDVDVVSHLKGEGVLEKVKESKPQVIFLDLHLPDISGWAILTQLQADLELKKIPIVITSILNESSQIFNMGAVEFQLKPISRPQLYQALEAAHNVLTKQVLEPKRKNPIVLLAEDQETNRTLLADFLEVKGYQVISVSNGIEAIKQAQEKLPNIILMDVQMPGISGLEAIIKIRQRPILDKTPIIAITGLAMPGEKEKCLQAGANGYITKPIGLKLLQQEIQKFLQI